MNTKNKGKRPVRAGRKIIPSGGVTDVPDHILLQPRLQKMRKAGILVFPYVEKKEEAPTKPEPPKAAELNKGKPSKSKPKVKKAPAEDNEETDKKREG